MEHRYVATIGAPRPEVFAVLAQIDTYHRWLDVVDRVDADPHGSPGEPAWFFTLRARVGPFARSKRLRVVESAVGGASAVDRVRLERRERDGRNHAPWIFDAALSETADPADDRAGSVTVLTLTLTYGGGLWTSALNPVLDHQLRTATRQLETLALADR